MDSNSYFWQIQRGEQPVPQAVQTLGGKILCIDADAGTVETEFQGLKEFTNPAGKIQGGFLAAMLDDTLGPALAALLNANEFASTVSLHVNYISHANPGKILGFARVMKKGLNICHIAGEVSQDGKIIAAATAVAMIHKL